MVDTRSKIVDRERVPAGAVWFAGHFDPLLAEHARMLRNAKASGRVLAVEIVNPSRPLLAQRARAELVAGLAGVGLVCLRGSVSDWAAGSSLSRPVLEGLP